MRHSIFALFASSLVVLGGCSGSSPKADASTDALKDAGGDRDAAANVDGAAESANEVGADGAPAEAGSDSAVDPPVDAAVEAPVDAAVDAPVDAPDDAMVEAPVDAVVDAPDDVTAADAAVDPVVDAVVDAVVDSATEAPLTYTLTIENYIAWCSVSVNGGAATAVSSETLTFPAGTVVNLHGDALNATFFWDYWYGTDGDTSPAHDVSMTTTATMDSDKVVQACCPIVPPPGTPCPPP